MSLCRGLLCLVVGWIALASLAVYAKEPPRDAAPPPAAKADAVPVYLSREQLPQAVTLAKLSNGLTVLVQENHVAPVATVRCFVKNTGSAYEGKWLGAGLSHVLEHVVAGGSTTHRDEKDISRIIDTFGGATNAFTSSDMTVYFIDCPARQAATAIELLADSMQHIKFEPKEFERELRVVRRELADGEVDRRRVLHQQLNLTVYTQHPVRHPVIGYLEVLDRTTNETIINFYRERYIPSNQVFVVVGDVKTDEVLAQIARQYRGTLRTYVTNLTLPDEPEQLTPRESIREMEGSTFDMAFAWPTIKLSHPDLYALDVAAYILAEGESSRMVRDLKYARQLVLSVHSASYTPADVQGWFGIFATAKPEQWKEAAAEIERSVYRLCDELVGPEELAKAKKQKAAELVFQTQTVQQAADQLGRNYLSAADPLFDERYVAGIQKVTAEEIRAACRRYLVPHRLNRVMIVPPGASPAKSQRAADTAETPVQLHRLPNGLRVLVKRSSQLPMVNVQAFVLGGLLVDSPETAGRSAMLAEMLDKGTAEHTALQIADYFDSIGGQLSMSAGRNTVYGGATVLRDDFPKALALFAECFLRPSFPADEYARAQRLALAAIGRRADDPHQEAFELYYNNLPAGSPYHVLEGGTKESVERLKPADLAAYHAEYFVPGNMVVTVFGDVDPQRALDLVSQEFGKLPAGKTPTISFDRPNAIAEDIVRSKATGKDTAMIVLGFPTPSIRDQSDYAAMIVLDAITSGYSYPGGWLHEELRGAGLVYFVHAFQLTGPTPGFFTVLSQTRPDKLDEVVERIRKNLDRAKAGEITAEEFDVARRMVTALHAQEGTTMADQARQAALDELYGLGFTYDKGFDQRIERVTRDDVVAAARKYLQHSVLATTAPKNKKKP